VSEVLFRPVGTVCWPNLAEPVAQNPLQALSKARRQRNPATEVIDRRFCTDPPLKANLLGVQSFGIRTSPHQLPQQLPDRAPQAAQSVLQGLPLLPLLLSGLSGALKGREKGLEGREVNAKRLQDASAFSITPTITPEIARDADFQTQQLTEALFAVVNLALTDAVISGHHRYGLVDHDPIAWLPVHFLGVPDQVNQMGHRRPRQAPLLPNGFEEPYQVIPAGRACS